jgi:hypothetical protein
MESGNVSEQSATMQPAGVITNPIHIKVLKGDKESE